MVRRAVLAGVNLAIAAWLLVPNKQESQPFLDASVVGGCSPGFRDTDLPRSFFACNVEIKDLLRRHLDSRSLGTVARINDLELSLDKPGELRVGQEGNTVGRGLKGDRFLELHTPPKRQFIVSLPGGTTIRLDGGSSLKYLLNCKDTSIVYCRLEGQAHVRVPEGKDGRKGKKFVLENLTSQLLTYGGEYTVRSERGYTRAVRLGGSLTLVARGTGDNAAPEEYCNDLEAYSFLEGKDRVRDSFSLSHTDRESALRWTRTVRQYDKVPLRMFMTEMERWYGFRIESMQCLPKGVEISTSVCQDASMEELFAAMEGKGVSIYRKDGMFTFCPPAGRLERKWDNVAYGQRRVNKSKIGFLWFGYGRK